MSFVFKNRVIRISSRKVDSKYRIPLKVLCSDILVVNIQHELIFGLLYTFIFKGSDLCEKSNIYFIWKNNTIVWKNVVPSASNCFSAAHLK